MLFSLVVRVSSSSINKSKINGSGIGLGGRIGDMTGGMIGVWRSADVRTSNLSVATFSHILNRLRTQAPQSLSTT